MVTILAVFIIAGILLVVLTLCGLGELSLLLGAIFLLGCVAYIINKIMNIEDKLDMLLQKTEEAMSDEKPLAK